MVLQQFAHFKQSVSFQTSESAYLTTDANCFGFLVSNRVKKYRYFLRFLFIMRLMADKLKDVDIIFTFIETRK